jgi:hypothetical protein
MNDSPYPHGGTGAFLVATLHTTQIPYVEEVCIYSSPARLLTRTGNPNRCYVDVHSIGGKFSEALKEMEEFLKSPYSNEYKWVIPFLKKSQAWALQHPTSKTCYSCNGTGRFFETLGLPEHECATCKGSGRALR